ncbi:uncharacterized protein GGS22DRAFT_190444 [Annulohypoxylon maeteangense]|uniref:uncharacterized protein n=1 Tax=Annulohypoxylon maeteangense TaxID=1927788 RepID=UPI0020088A33|nr:uncharacterized protein GGS22DRAFT_190444 [Annulohypoxylon maeteangense]KAI0883136.1 hypothetical protein GGS22DRAFT_190444 [Annulohypoxylon maeteangense]
MEKKSPSSPSWACVAGSKDHDVQHLHPARINQRPASMATEPKATTSTTDTNVDVALLNATIATLNDDLARRTSDLIEIRYHLLSKTAEVDNLKSTVATLSEGLELAKAKEIGGSCKDTEIQQLKSEVASLRNALHTGVISIAQLYGPTSLQEFNAICGKGSKADNGTAVEYTTQIPKASHYQQTKTAPSLYDGSQHLNDGSVEGNVSAIIQNCAPVDAQLSSVNIPRAIVNLPPSKNIQQGSDNPNKKERGSKKPVRLRTNTAKRVNKPTATACVNKAPLGGMSQDADRPTDNCDGWTTIPVKNRPKENNKKRQNRKGKGAANAKVEGKGEEEGNGGVNSGPNSQAKKSQTVQKKVPGEAQPQQGSNTNPPQHRRARRPRGTVIGSASNFSQKPKQAREQAKDQAIPKNGKEQPAKPTQSAQKHGKASLPISPAANTNTVEPKPQSKAASNPGSARTSSLSPAADWAFGRK